MNDTIVIFDRIRENRKGIRKGDLTKIADTSLSQTIRRSIYTVTTTLITTTAVYICVPESAVRDFALPLIVGIASGCYSSIFIASPFWVILENGLKKKAVA
jgi:preprotein translocase subunit SecF